MRPRFGIDELIAAILIGMALGVGLVLMVSPSLPRCEEDQVIIGSGSFQDGLWSAYNCGPSLDSFVAR